MVPKRSLRNAAGWLLAIILILLGYIKRAKQKSFQKNIVTAIAFHNPNRELFKRIITWFKAKGYVFISSEQLIEILNNEIACPRGAVWISLDDGWNQNMDNVIPLAIQHNIPITIFIYTNAIEEGAFWWKKVDQALDLLPNRFHDTSVIRGQPEDIRRQILTTIDQAELSFSREAMNIEDIKRISSIPQITLGAHTATHPILPNCTDDQIEYELAESKQKIEKWIGKPVSVFAYPNGSFDGRERQFLVKYGYKLAATTENAFVKADCDHYLIPRNIIMDDGSFAENLCHALGIWEPIVVKLKRVVKKELYPDHAEDRDK